MVTPKGALPRQPQSAPRLTEQPPSSWTSAQPGPPKLQIEELGRARLKILGSEQAGPQRGTTAAAHEAGEPLACPVPVQERDVFPLKDFDDLTPDVDMFWDQRVQETDLGTGARSTVSLMKWEERDGSEYELAYKPALPGGSSKSGHRLVHNVLAYRLDQLLGFNVIVPAEMQEAPTDRKGPGLFMARARGDLATNVARQHPDLAGHPALCREMMKLDVMDYLLQADDRNEENYLIDQGADGKFKVTGIDNDFSFPSMPAPDPGKRLTVLDTEMARAITKLTPQDLQSVIPPKSLKPAAMSSLLKRLDALQVHVRSLSDQKKLIDPSDWPKHAPGAREGLMGTFETLATGGEPQSENEDMLDEAMQSPVMQGHPQPEPCADAPFSSGRISPSLAAFFHLPRTHG